MKTTIKRRLMIIIMILKNSFNYIFSYRFKKKFAKYKNKKKVILALTPSHGNLGDHAIAYAANRFLEDHFNDYVIIELTMAEVYKYLKSVKKVLNKDDIVFTIGGGNMNDIYSEEKARRLIVKKIKNNRVISLPQTINFSDTNTGRKEFAKTKRIYKKHNALTLIAREKKSYGIMKNNFSNNNTLISPDIVFYLEQIKLKDKIERGPLIVCFRSDNESYISVNKRSELIKAVCEREKRVVFQDTVLSTSISKEVREKHLLNIWTNFAGAKLVITDRLHGMIFCAITNTPCIVIRNSDHKITSTYNTWMKNLNFIKLLEKEENILEVMEKLMSIKLNDKLNFKSTYFNELAYKLSKM